MTSKSLTVLMLADVTGNIDEGMKVTAANLSKSLEQAGHDVRVINPSESLSVTFWDEIRNIDPHIVHYVPGPSAKGILLGRLSSLVTGAPLVMSAPLPQLGPIGKFLLWTIGPRRVFTQSRQTEALFERFGVDTLFVPTGVDTDRFTPVSDELQSGLRDKYDIPDGEAVALHVGHIKAGRNLQWLKRVQQESDFQVLIVGSTTTEVDQQLRTSLEAAGCDVRTDFYSKIEELYELSDVYVFPTRSGENSIQCPASVLEALSAGTPVISTPFGALPDIFQSATTGVKFADEVSEFVRLVEQSKNTDCGNPRELARRFDWKQIGDEVQKEYLEVIGHVN